MKLMNTTLNMFAATAYQSNERAPMVERVKAGHGIYVRPTCKLAAQGERLLVTSVDSNDDGAVIICRSLDGRTVAVLEREVLAHSLGL